DGGRADQTCAAARNHPLRRLVAVRAYRKGQDPFSIQNINIATIERESDGNLETCVKAADSCYRSDIPIGARRIPRDVAVVARATILVRDEDIAESVHRNSKRRKQLGIVAGYDGAGQDVAVAARRIH